jgi:dTDP-4-amino-4,6-dideoxygalactose transaminase
MSIPLVNLPRQYQQIAPEIDRAIKDVCTRSDFVLGSAVSKFERAFADYVGAKHCIGVASGTDALHLILRALGIGPGDEVILPANTFIATAQAVWCCGADPVLVDCDERTATIDPRAVGAAITSRTKALLPVHLYGQPADMEPLLQLAREHNVHVIEDAAQAHGAEYKGRRAGSLGDLGCFSFYPGKNLGAFGEGGAVVTDRSDWAGKIALLRDWGQQGKYQHVLPGYNYRMDTIQAAVLKAKMDYIEAWTEARRAVAARYDLLLADGGFRRPAPPSDCRHVYHVYAIHVPHRGGVQQALAAAGIGTGIHYPVPVHLQTAYGDLGYRSGDFPVTEAVADRFLSLPIYAELRPSQMEEIVAELERSCVVRSA